MIRRPPRSTLFPSPTRFRSASGALASAAVGGYAISCSGGVAPHYSFSPTTPPPGFSLGAQPLTLIPLGKKGYGSTPHNSPAISLVGLCEGQTPDARTTPPHC